jgi:hypothetical protein
MNEHSERDLDETRTRRAVLATAGGLLLPAGLLALDGEDAEATKRAKRRRRRRRKQVGVWANDVVVNFRNATDQSLRVGFSSFHRSRTLTVESGKESGFDVGIPAWAYSALMRLYIRFPDLPPGDAPNYEFLCANAEIFTPHFKCWWYPDTTNLNNPTYLGGSSLRENDTSEITHGGYRFHIHRWTNGKEPLDDYDEWYTRFFVTMSNV